MAAARMRWSLVIATAGLVLAVALGRQRAADLLLRHRIRLAIEKLSKDVDSSKLPAARFSEFPVNVAPASAMRGPAAAPLIVDADVQSIISLASRSNAPSASAASAAALAAIGRTNEAIELLKAAIARNPRNAGLWNDLAATRYQANDTLYALVAADAALRVDPKMPEALYNRGLALDRLGFPMNAVKSWRECLQTTADAGLAIQARDSLRATEAPTVSSNWRSVSEQFLRAAARSDVATVERITRQFPSEVRRTVETVVLGDWAKATLAGNAVQSADALRILHSTAHALSGRGETLLADIVALIDRAVAADDTKRISLFAQGQSSYDAGRTVYAARDYANAERLLGDAEAIFRRAGSPMEQVARSWRASVLIAMSRSGEAKPMLRDVLSAERGSPGHRANLAATEFLLAICSSVSGEWNAAADAARSSASLYRASGETVNALDSEMMLAEIYELVGQPELAWQYRPRGFEAMSESGAWSRLLTAVGTATRGATKRGEYDVALSLLDVEDSIAQLVRDPLLSAEIHRRRAIVQNARGEHEARDEALARARIAIAANKDADLRAWLDVNLVTTEATMMRERDPRRAIALFDRAVAFVRQTGRRIELPEILLERGRAYARTGDDAAAWRDFADGLEELEAERSGIPDLQLRSRIFDTAEELFHESVALHARRGEAKQAFAVAEQARGRLLLDQTAAPVASADAVGKRLTPDTLILEYAVLPHQLVVFAIGNRGVHVRVVDVDEARLAAPGVERYVLEPFRDQIAAARKLIIVPDKVLQRTSFAALRWNGRYLMETHTISEAPSASLLVARTPPKRTRDETLLIVGNPAPDQGSKLSRLPAVKREIESVRALYPNARVLFEEDATRAHFVEAAPHYSTIHFAGHGLSDEESVTASLVFAHGPSESGRMESSEIALLRLPLSPLVVLDACGTLRGRTLGLEGMPSLARSFLAAGASAVVGTLDDVNDRRSADLILSFHRHMVAGEEAPGALRAAQIEAIRRGGAAADPENWAPFVVYTTVSSTAP